MSGEDGRSLTRLEDFRKIHQERKFEIGNIKVDDTIASAAYYLHLNFVALRVAMLMRKIFFQNRFPLTAWSD